MRLALQTQGVFACHCEVFNDRVVAGIFVSNRPGETVTLIDRDDPDFSLTVTLPQTQSGYQVELYETDSNAPD